MINTKESIIPILRDTNLAARSIRQASNSERQTLLHSIADQIDQNRDLILAENEKDVLRMDDQDPKKDRLILNPERIDDLITGLKSVAALQDPVGNVIYEATTPEGLSIVKKTVPLGVVGVIYESRPNVTVDVASLCLRSGNGVILRGGSDAADSNRCLVSLIHNAMEQHGIDKRCLQLLPTDRQFVKELLEADKYVDIIIPRGSQQLIDFVRDNAKVPTIETGAGVCHTYVQEEADLDKAASICVNAKVSRPSVCNALDTIVVDEKVAKQFLPKICAGMKAYEVEIFADATAFDILSDSAYPILQRAEEDDFGKEFLDFKCSVKVVSGFEEAVDHITRYSSKHSEAIVTENPDLQQRFLNEIDAAAVYTNASTRFTDGGVFGLGAEIGISTQKLHARGPFALEKLITEKWIVTGDGQVR